MKLGELKRSLQRMSGDLDDCEVMFVMLNDKEKEQYDLLAFTAYTNIPEKETPVIILGSHQVALKFMADGNLQYPDGTKPGNQGFELNG